MDREYSKHGKKRNAYMILVGRQEETTRKA
jgi:hypothetical protein